MKFKELLASIEVTQNALQKRALRSVNQMATLRSWLVGCYIVEFEQKGKERAKYGDKLLKTLSGELKNKKIKGFSVTNLKLFRKFYITYPQIRQPAADVLSADIKSALPKQLQTSISQPVADQLKSDQNTPIKSSKEVIPPISGYRLLEHLSFRHFTELIKLDDPLKRIFYEQEAIKGNWSARQLKRQIDSLLLERVGLSKDKQALIKTVKHQQSSVNVEEIIKDPYVLEFTGFRELPSYSELDLESELLNKIQYFLVELGNGFCFEARQKRITVGNEHDRIDLVFYHRILKCHVLIDLKTCAFSHADTGQMNFYLNYFKENVMEKGDRPPVGIILCTDKAHQKVKYATAGLDNKLFVSKYLVELPTEQELLKLLKQ